MKITFFKVLEENQQFSKIEQMKTSLSHSP